MDPTERQKQLKLKFNANLLKYVKQILELHKRYQQATLGGIGMHKVVPADSLGETFAQARILHLMEKEQKEHPSVSLETLKLYSEGYCEGLVVGVFLSELGLAKLITREK